MKAVLVQDFIELPVGSLRGAYPKKAGAYLVDDGSMFNIAIIDDNMGDEDYPFCMTIPRYSVIQEYERIGERDVDLLQKQLSECNKGISDNHTYISDKMGEVDEAVVDAIEEFKKDLLSSLKGGSSDINIADLTKLIAVAQKPDLLKT